jgi:hypothetical protein
MVYHISPAVFIQEIQEATEYKINPDFVYDLFITIQAESNEPSTKRSEEQSMVPVETTNISNQIIMNYFKQLIKERVAVLRNAIKLGNCRGPRGDRKEDRLDWKGRRIEFN